MCSDVLCAQLAYSQDIGMEVLYETVVWSAFRCYMPLLVELWFVQEKESYIRRRQRETETERESMRKTKRMGRRDRGGEREV